MKQKLKKKMSKLLRINTNIIINISYFVSDMKTALLFPINKVVYHQCPRDYLISVVQESVKPKPICYNERYSS